MNKKQMISIDKLCYHSKLRYENASVKTAFAIITLWICVMSRSIAAAGIVMVVTGILTVVKGGISFKKYLKYMLVPLTFLIFSTMALVCNIKREPLDLFAISVGKWYFTASYAAFCYALQLIIVSMASVSCLYFLAFSTPMPDLLDVLRKIHCPQLIIELMMLIYRFIFILLHTAYDILTSQKCRLGNKNFPTSIRSFGKMGAVLMIRAVDRADKLYCSMEARGYNGMINVLSESHPPRKKIIIYIVLFDMALLIFAIITKGWSFSWSMM